MIKEKNAPFFGVSTAIVTPFSDDLSLDLPAFRRLIEIQKENGADSVTVAGTTGEAPTLSIEEEAILVSEATKYKDGGFKIIAGAGSNDTKKAVSLARAAYMNGADALLAVTPYYNKTSPRGLLAHFFAIADATPLPVILYNVPSRTGISIPFSLYSELAAHERIVGLKDACGDLSFALRFLREYKDSLYLYCGNDDLFLAMLAIGAEGCISVASNVLPKEVSEIYKLYKSGKASEAEELNRQLSPIFSGLFAEPNPIPVKAALSEYGLIKNNLRLPLVPAEENIRAKLISSLEKIRKKEN